jgi:hypothetical protein
LAAPYRDRSDSVPTLSGCIGGRMPVGQLIERSGPHVVRLNSPRESIDAWLKRHPQARRSFFVDIVGGGYPAQFRAIRKCQGR